MLESREKWKTFVQFSEEVLTRKEAAEWEKEAAAGTERGSLDTADRMGRQDDDDEDRAR